jgi:16S rRNA (cytidine1402-2'-O)-methyltransferase
MLFLVATPIGNLGDITYRAVEILKNVDIILCEDTRHSQVLLHHYEISAPLISFHKFNEAEREERIIAELQSGKKIAVISDAGTPGIADPGERLVARCVIENIPVVPIPGASSAVTALCASGLSALPYQHLGFIPKKGIERALSFYKLLEYEGTSICFESPHRIKHLLEGIHLISPERKLVLARELTKKFEEFLRGTAEELLAHIEKFPIKGEIVLLVGAAEEKPATTPLTAREHVQQLMDTYHLPKGEAIKIAAQHSERSRREIYKELIDENE